MVIISQYNFSPSILGGSGTWKAASSAACAVLSFLVLFKYLM
jgi:hypothetical protein